MVCHRYHHKLQQQRQAWVGQLITDLNMVGEVLNEANTWNLV